MNAASIACDPSGYAALTRPTRPLLKALANRVQNHYTRAQELPRQDSCAGYGEEVKRLKSAIEELRTHAGK